MTIIVLSSDHFFHNMHYHVKWIFGTSQTNYGNIKCRLNIFAKYGKLASVKISPYFGDKMLPCN